MPSDFYMQISILNKQRKYPVDEKQIHHWIRQVLLMQKMKHGELSIVFVNNRRMRTYNRDYRKIDRATDVLAFPMLEGIGGDLHPGFLGDIMISLEMTEKEAYLYQKAMSEQLLILLVHGILHLLGYDHERSESEAHRMSRREQFLLKRIER